jgi:hypothetical protein
MRFGSVVACVVSETNDSGDSESNGNNGNGHGRGGSKKK